METTILLYSRMDRIGKQKIRSELTSDIESSRHYIEMIMDNCEKHIEAADEDALGSLCEGVIAFYVNGLLFTFYEKSSNQ
jgi:hypothetical protein